MKVKRSRLHEAFFSGPVSPARFLAAAPVLTLLYLALEAAGLRPMTGILSGSLPPGAASPTSAALLGLVYIGAYLGFVLAAPVLCLSSLVLLVTRLLLPEPPREKSAGSGQGARSVPSWGSDHGRIR